MRGLGSSPRRPRVRGGSWVRRIARVAGRWRVAGPWRGLSLRSRLSFIVASAVAVAVIAVSGFAWLVVRDELYGRLDDQLTIDAATLVARPGVRNASPVAPSDRSEREPARRRDRGLDTRPRWQVLDAEGRPVGSGGLPVTDRAYMIATGRSARVVEEVTVGLDEYRMLTVPVGGGGAIQVAISSDPVDYTLRKLGLVLVLGCVGGVVGSWLLGRTVARAGLAPVEKLTRATEHVTATRNLGATIQVRGDDEIARLSRSFNAMLTALDDSRAAQRMLVEDAGHELRTPLTSLRNNIELLIHADSPAAAGRVLPAAERASLLRDLDAQVTELANLTTELVQLARDDSTTEPIEAVDLADVVATAVERARVRTPRATITMDLVPASVQGWPALLERAVLNLLDNAVKWSPAEGVVRVGLDRDGDFARLTIADNGPGIAEVDREKVFERFYRAPAARAMPGSGLGLAIVAQAVARHGGTVTVGSVGSGGALLTMRLPADFSSDS